MRIQKADLIACRLRMILSFTALDRGGVAAVVSFPPG